MNLVKLAILNLGFALASAGAGAATQPTTYVLTITNGSAMPLSPIVVYTQGAPTPKSSVGTVATTGFVELCQTGNPVRRIQELGMASDVTFKTQTMGMLLPGESRVIEVEVEDPLQQNIQFETMYGKTKDLCAVGGVTSHGLYALKQHVTAAVLGKDNVVQTGAFQDPALPMGQTYLDPKACMGISDAVTCLRSLALPARMMGGKIRYFSGYLSSVNMLLETKYGAGEALNLTIPTSGAVQFDLKLKH